MNDSFKLYTFSIKRVINFYIFFLLSLSIPILADEREEKRNKNEKLQEIKETLLSIQNKLNILNGSPLIAVENNISNSDKLDSNLSSDKNFSQEITLGNQNSEVPYFFVIRTGYQILNDISLDFAHGPNGEIKTNGGYNLFFDAGRKIGNLDFGIGLGFNNSDLGELDWLNKKYSAEGETKTYQIQFSGGYNLQLNDALNLRLGGALGCASRHDHYEIKLLSPNSINENKVNLSTQISLQLGVKIVENFTLISGYRFNYLTSSGAFGELFYNSFELGLLWDL